MATYDSSPVGSDPTGLAKVSSIGSSPLRDSKRGGRTQPPVRVSWTVEVRVQVAKTGAVAEPSRNTFS